MQEDTKPSTFLTCISWIPGIGSWARKKWVQREMMLSTEETTGSSSIQNLSVNQLDTMIQEGVLILDVRNHLDFGLGHIPGSISVGAGRILGAWANNAFSNEEEIILVLPSEEILEDVLWSLSQYGFNKVKGFVVGLNAWREAGKPLSSLEQVSALDLEEVMKADAHSQILDVRTEREWNSGHIEGAIHIPGEEIQTLWEKVPEVEGKTYIICGAGYRSNVAASVLAKNGRQNMVNICDGMNAWKREGLPLV